MTIDQGYTAHPHLLTRLPLCEGRCHSTVINLLTACLLLLPGYEYYWHRFDVTQWDLLLAPLLGDIAGRNIKWQSIIDLINKLS